MQGFEHHELLHLISGCSGCSTVGQRRRPRYRPRRVRSPVSPMENQFGAEGERTSRCYSNSIRENNRRYSLLARSLGFSTMHLDMYDWVWRLSKDHCSPRANRQLQSTGTAGNEDITNKEIIPPPQRNLMLPVSLAWSTYITVCRM